MKMSVKRYLKGLAVLCFIMGCLILAPGAVAKAEITSDSFISLGNDRIVQDNVVKTSGKGWTYDEEKNILTLKDYDGGWMRVDSMGEDFTICVVSCSCVC